MERVNHPSHYALPNGLEALDIARYLDFNLGNAVKYIVRAGKKQEEGISIDDKKLEDLRKALFYLNDEIKMLEEKSTRIVTADQLTVTAPRIVG